MQSGFSLVRTSGSIYGRRESASRRFSTGIESSTSKQHTTILLYFLTYHQHHHLSWSQQRLHEGDCCEQLRFCFDGALSRFFLPRTSGGHLQVTVSYQSLHFCHQLYKELRKEASLLHTQVPCSHMNTIHVCNRVCKN